MNAMNKSFFELSANDLMSREITMIPDNMPLREAARTLLRNQVSGAPVIDCTGALVGVLSATDFVRQLDQSKDGGARSALEHPESEFFADWQMSDTMDLPTDAVRNFMTHQPVTAQPDTSVGELARMMVDAHIHRVIVVDVDDGSPVGIVTSTDILGAVARCDALQAIG
jgi:CBS domain-containing membrane protein